MKNSRIVILFTFVLILMLAGGCDKRTSPTNSNIDSSAAETAATATGTPIPTPTPTPTPVPPQEIFLDGAKELISTDMINLLTEEENGAALLGIESNFLKDLNSRSIETDLTAAFSNLVQDGKPVKQGGNLSLAIQHDAATGDSSLGLALGIGTDTNRNASITILGDTAVMKSGSTNNKVMLYTLPNGGGANALDDVLSVVTGLLSDDGKASSFVSNLKDRIDLSARFLGPWITATEPEDYTDSTQTRKLCGQDVPLRIITLNMEGQRAYAFVLDELQTLQADSQFSCMDGWLGDLMCFLSKDISLAFGKTETTPVTTATNQLVNDLKSLTPEQITAAKFIVSMIFNDKHAIGIEIEASTTEKAFKLNLMLYRNGPEHQFNLYYLGTGGDSTTINLLKVSSGGAAYDVSGNLQVKNNKGEETASGQYIGTLDESESSYDLRITSFSLNINIVGADGKKEEAIFGGDLAYVINFTDEAGYSGTGNGSISLDTPLSKIKMDLGLSLHAMLSDAVVIEAPAYIKSKAVTITDKPQLFETLGLDWNDVAGSSRFMQALVLILSLVIGS